MRCRFASGRIHALAGHVRYDIIAIGIRITLLFTAMFLTAGCTAVGLGAYMIFGDDDKAVQVKAEYTGLDGQTTAIMVVADDTTLFEYPTATESVTAALAAELSTRSQITVLDPRVTREYRDQHPHWDTLPYRDVLEQLNATRLLWVELVQYSTHAPGDPHVRQGKLIANLAVVEATDPNTLAYQSTVQIQYPPNRPLGSIDLDRSSVERGMVAALGQRALRLFSEHTLVRKN